MKHIKALSTLSSPSLCYKFDLVRFRFVSLRLPHWMAIVDN